MIIRILIASAMAMLVMPAFAEDPSHREVVFYFDNERLLTIEFDVTSNGKPLQQAWEEFLDQEFRRVDKNGDGKITGGEADALPNPRVLQVFGRRFTQRVAPDSMDRAAFAKHIEKLGFRPFQIDIQPPANTNNMRYTVYGRQNNPQQAAETLFAKLDENSDGKLSLQEMKKPSLKLSKLDLDQDETISSSELAPMSSLPIFVSPSSRSPSTPQTPFVAFNRSISARDIASRITKTYDKNPIDNALSKAELGMSGDRFKRHDLDQNGTWDFEEIQQFLRSPQADVVVKIQVGGNRRPGASPIAFEYENAINSEVKNAIGSLNLDTIQMEFTVNAAWNRNFEMALKSQFNGLDQDKNGYIDEKESARIPNASALFRELDQDLDGKLFFEEMRDRVLPIADLMGRQLRVSVTDRGRDLFRILDSDGDNRLAVREMRAMADRAELWDRDGDREINLDDVPQQYRLVTTRGNANLFNGFRGNLVPVAVPGMPSSQAAPPDGPIWFQRMDRNGDGDLSMREFLGKAETFQEMDKDKDRLIDPREAAEFAK